MELSELGWHALGMAMVHFIPPVSRRLAALAASLDQTPVFIEGEAGTGRAAIASWIHRNSACAGYPFGVLKVKADLSQEALETHLKHNHGGSLLIENIELLDQTDPSVATALLHYLKSHSLSVKSTNPAPHAIERLHSTRLFCTSLLPLERLATHLGDRSWLSHLQEIQIKMPALRTRRLEFEDLALGILEELVHSLKLHHIRRIEPKAMTALQAYEWPGNLRELRNILHAAVVTVGKSGGAITWEALPSDFTQGFERYQSNRLAFETLLHFPK